MELKKFTSPTPKIILLLLCGSIFGVLARLGMIQLTTYDGAFLSGVIWANFGACIVMGYLVQSSALWDNASLIYSGTKASVPLYTGLSTGFCGTFSSFSSVILEIFEKAANLDPASHFHYPTAGYGVMEFLAVVLGQFGTSILAFYMGKHICEYVEDSTYLSFTLSTRAYRFLERGAEIVGILAYIVVVVLIATKSDNDWRSWTFSCLFAPWGAFLRWYLAKILNARKKSFPLGTFAANVLGTLVLASLNIVVRGKSKGHKKQLVTDLLSCQVLSGVDDGFCGALTTVSTFVSELSSLKTKQAYKYGVASIMVSFCFVVVTLGSYAWAVGLTEPVC